MFIQLIIRNYRDCSQNRWLHEGSSWPFSLLNTDQIRGIAVTVIEQFAYSALDRRFRGKRPIYALSNTN